MAGEYACLGQIMVGAHGVYFYPDGSQVEHHLNSLKASIDAKYNLERLYQPRMDLQ
jgi:hypothetical protein